MVRDSDGHGYVRAVAVVGLYRSGSSFWAGALSRLGVDMGAPFWERDDDHPDNHFEPLEFSKILRPMWDEPSGVSCWGVERRKAALRDYARGRGPVFGAKHPLFCLMLPELREVWGPDLLVIHSRRRFADSLASIRRTSFPWSDFDMCRIQSRLWETLNRELETNPPDLSFDLFEMSEGSRRDAVLAIADKMRLDPTEEQIRSALNLFRG